MTRPFPCLDPPISTVLYGLDGSKSYFYHGWLHRINGPAVTFADGSHYWFLEGEEITQQIDEAIANGVLRPFRNWQPHDVAVYIVKFVNLRQRAVLAAEKAEWEASRAEREALLDLVEV